MEMTIAASLVTSFTEYAEEHGVDRGECKCIGVVDAIAEGLFHPSMKAKLEALEAEKASLEVQL